MSSSRLTLALSAGKLVITNRERVSVGLELVSVDEDSGVITKHIRTIRPTQTLDLTRFTTVKNIRKSERLKRTISTRRIFVHDTWSDKK